MKKSLSLLLAIAMVISMFAGTVFAAGTADGETLQKLGVIKGDLSGNLNEEKEWKRQDVTVLLSRLYGEEDKAAATTTAHGFTDVAEPFYNGYVAWAKEKGLFTGKTETTFAPEASIKNSEFATVVLRALGLQKEKFEENLPEAIKLGLLPEGTEADASAVRGATYTSIVKALDTNTKDGKKLGTTLNLAGYEITDLAVVGATSTVAKTIKVEFNTELKELATIDVSVTDVDGNVVPVEKVTFDGKVATVTTVSALAQKAHTVKIAKATSKEGSTLANASQEFTYTKGVPASVAIENTVVALGKNVKYVVKDANGVDITADFPLSNFDVSSSKPGVVNTDNLTTGLDDMAVISLTLKENGEVTTGNVSINVVRALSIAISEVKLSSAEDKPVYLNTGNAINNDNKLSFVVKNQDGDVVRAKNSTTDKEGYSVTYASSNTNVAQVTNDSNEGFAGDDHGKITALSPGTAVITANVQYGDAKTSTSYTVTVKAAQTADSFTLDKSSVTVVNNDYKIAQQVKVTLYNQYKEVYKDSGLDVKVTTNDSTKGQIAGNSLKEYTTAIGADGTVSINLNSGGTNGSTTVTFEIVNKSTLGKKTVTANSVAEHARKTGYEVTLSQLKLDADWAYTGSGETKERDTSKAAAVESALDIYVIDANGNRVYPINNNENNGNPGDEKKDKVRVDFKNEDKYLQIDANKDKITTVAGAPIGKETVTVYYNDLKLKTFEVEIVKTSQDIVVRAVQVKSSIEVTVGDTFSVIGTGDGSKKLEAFIGYDVRDKKVDGAKIDTKQVGGSPVDEAVTGNVNIVSLSNNNIFEAEGAGTTTLTVKVNGQWKTLTVVVKAN